MKKYIYLALVDKDFTLDEKVDSYFQENNIEIIKYYEKFNLLMIESKNLLLAEDIKYIDYLELEQEFHAQEE